MSRRRKEAPLSSPRCWMWNRWLGSLGLVVRTEGGTWRQLERQKRRGRKGEGTSSASVLALLLLQRQCLLEEGEKFLPLFNSPFALFSAASFAVVFPLFFLRWRHQDGRSWRRKKSGVGGIRVVVVVVSSVFAGQLGQKREGGMS